MMSTLVFSYLFFHMVYYFLAEYHRERTHYTMKFKAGDTWGNYLRNLARQLLSSVACALSFRSVVGPVSHLVAH